MLSGLDLLLLAVLGIGMVRGWFTGAVRQIVGVLGWMVGFILAASLMGPVGSTVVQGIGFLAAGVILTTLGEDTHRSGARRVLKAAVDVAGQPMV